MIDGLIVKGIAGFYYVKTDLGTYRCKARGIFKKNGIAPMVGDSVKIEVQKDGDAVVRQIGNRKNFFIRPPISNVDCFVVVVSAAKPKPNFSIIDRFLVMAEKNKTEAILCVNKSDVAQGEELARICEIYEGIYPVVRASGKTGEGIGRLAEMLGSRKCALSGPSGVGKSTLLNALFPAASAQVGEISEKTSRGKHTTRHAEIFETDSGALIFDTPGFTSFDVTDAEPEMLKHYYPEIAMRLGECRFRDCSHLTEPECAVREAVLTRGIHESRYRSYVEQYMEMKERKMR